MRQFFSGNSIEQAVMSAARHYEVDPDSLAYSVRDKKHGFLNIRRRVVIEVDPENLIKSEPKVEETAAAVESVEDAAIEAGAHIDEGDEESASGDDSESTSEAGPDEEDAEDAESDEQDQPAVHEHEGDAEEGAADEEDQVASVDEEYEEDDDEEPKEERRPRSRRGRGRRGGQKSRRDVKIEEFSWGENDGWDEEELEDEEDSRELIAVEICLERILDVMDLEIEYSIVEGETIEVEFSGEDSDFLIEEDGKVLKAIEHIVPRMARAVIGRSLSVHVDCDGFRADHESSLQKMANQAAEEVVRRGRAKTLNPMNPADRRIVHLALVDHPDVDTISQGHGFMKRVKIVLANN